MSYLFKIQGKVVFPNEETLLIFPFSEIWDRDQSEGKQLALQEFAFVEFYTSYLKSNPFRDYPEERKFSVIKEGILLPAEWKPDVLVEKAIDFIEDVQLSTFSYRYWSSNKNALEQQINFFNTFDMGELNPKTMNPIYKPADIPNAIAAAEKVLMTINNLQKKVEEELYEVSKTKGGKSISPFAKISR